MCAVHDRIFNCNYCPSIIANNISKHNVVIRSISHCLPFPGSQQNIPMSAMITTITNDEDTTHITLSGFHLSSVGETPLL